jgi:nucleoside-diphosphate-sugar epimerase
MKIAVTGSTGGLGRSLVEFLIAQKIEVVALGRNSQIGEELTRQGAVFLKGAINDSDYLLQAFRSCDLVIHSAGLASPWGPWDDFYQANVMGTEKVLQAMDHLQIKKLVYLSTPSLYFSGSPVVNVKEDSPLPAPQTFYARSKLLADQMVISESKRQNLNSVLFRPRAIFGPYDRAILPRMLRIMRKGFFPLPDGGHSLVDITAVENVVHAIWLSIQLMNTQQFSGEIFNISNAEPLSVKDLTFKMSEILNLKVKFISVPLKLLSTVALGFDAIANHITHREPVMSQYAIESLGVTQTLSIEKAQRVLGYKPVISLDQALKNFAGISKKKRAEI